MRDFMVLPIVMLISWIFFSACTESVKSTEDLSDFFEIRTIKGSFKYRQHLHIYVKKENGQGSFLGSMLDPEWAQKPPFKYYGLVGKNYAVSNDGKTIIYTHNAILAQGNSQKAGGLYQYQHGEGDKMLFGDSEYVIASAQYPKTLPKDVLAIIRSKTREAITTSGEITPLLLLGGTKMHYAAYTGDNQTVSELIGADNKDLDQINFWDMTPLVLAILNGQDETAIHLLNLGAQMSVHFPSPIYLASAYRRTLVLDALLKRKVSYYYFTDDGSTPFHATLYPILDFSIYSKPPDDEDKIIEVLNVYLSHGADINLRDGKGQTLLHLTLSAPVIRFLIENGIDVNAIDNEGNTALHNIVTMTVDERYEAIWKEKMLPLLQMIGHRMSDLDMVNIAGISPLQRSVQVNNIRTAEFLISAGANPNVPYIHRGLGPKIPGQSILERIDYIKKEDWWKQGR